MAAAIWRAGSGEKLVGRRRMLQKALRKACPALRYSEHLQQETLLGGSIATEPRPGTFEARAVELTRAASGSRPSRVQSTTTLAPT